VKRGSALSLLQALASVSVFRQATARTFANTPPSETRGRNIAGSARDIARAEGSGVPELFSKSGLRVNRVVQSLSLYSVIEAAKT